MLQSERLVFREYGEQDFTLYYSIFSNEQVMRYAWIDAIVSEAELRPMFGKALRDNGAGQSRSAIEMAVFAKEDGGYVGYADIQLFERNSQGGHGEIGYFLLPEQWGRGYATEIARALIGYCFGELGLHRVSARCDAFN